MSDTPEPDFVMISMPGTSIATGLPIRAKLLAAAVNAPRAAGHEQHMENVLEAILEILAKPLDIWTDYELTETGGIAASEDGPECIDPAMPYSECDKCFRAEWRGQASRAFTAMIDHIRSRK